YGITKNDIEGNGYFMGRGQKQGKAIKSRKMFSCIEGEYKGKANKALKQTICYNYLLGGVFE
ncbi:MAG TPA: hypothetical protein VFD15_00045, partial [Clostridia bacterium]|nr:hypothetical protein [Clostridia bacterium]